MLDDKKETIPFIKQVAKIGAALGVALEAPTLNPRKFIYSRNKTNILKQTVKAGFKGTVNGTIGGAIGIVGVSTAYELYKNNDSWFNRVLSASRRNKDREVSK
jgi:hypothetical protein